MIDSEKKTLRKRYKSLRDSVAHMQLQSDNMYSVLIDSDIYINADTVLLYWSHGSEVRTHRMIDKALADGKAVALPRCLDSDGNMQFYLIKSLSDLSDGMYGIKEPETDIVADDFTCDSLCVVPGLSFSYEGYRLGYGKGYYDRFLDTFKGLSVGLCYKECLTDYLPTDRYDKKVNYIISNNTIIKIKEE